MVLHDPALTLGLCCLISLPECHFPSPAYGPAVCCDKSSMGLNSRDPAPWP